MSNAIVAAGHPLTAQSAATILSSGGNAFDAAVSALLTASVCEPALSSLGGGGFLMACPRDDKPLLLDFFTQTPHRQKAPEHISVDSFVCDFGSAQQTFHIGAGTGAVPGCVKGVFETARRFGTMPMRDLIQPVTDILSNGVEITQAQAYLISILTPIFMSSSARKFYESRLNPGEPVKHGERVFLPQYADLLESLAIEGDDLFYRGEVAKTIDNLSREAGAVVTREDMAAYQAMFREPLSIGYRGSRLLLNPAPSVGGIRIAMALKHLERSEFGPDGFGSGTHLTETLAALGRLGALDAAQSHVEADVDRQLFESYRKIRRNWKLAPRGTTHISIIDRHGNAAALTASNGEGCGVMIPGTGIMMNNMLGEEDLNPDGLSGWPSDTRLSSMMCPTIANDAAGRLIVTGSGGSNRIPSAIAQVLVNLINFDMAAETAVDAPRLHAYDGVAYAENFFEPAALNRATGNFQDQVLFSERNVFFGGVHTVCRLGSRAEGSGDPRRAGVCISIP